MFAKKNLVAAAALLALVGAAQAQSSVKLYGYLEAGVGSFKAAGGKTIGQVTSGDMMTSFIGLSGAEDLGGGLKAEFVLESFVGGDTGGNVTNQAGGFWSRGSWVGLSGGFGKVALGQYDTPLFVAGLSYNPFGSSWTYSPTMRHFYNLGSLSASSRLALNRTDTGSVNSVSYDSPSFGGLTASLQYSLKESSAGTDSNSYGVGLAYNAGPLSAMLTYTDAGKSSTNSGAYPGDFKAINANASYDFGMLKAFGQYTRFKYGSTFLQATAGLAAADKATVWQLGVSAPVSGSGTVMASYGQAKYKEPSADASSKILSLGYDHALSKRTSAYAALSTEKLTSVPSGRGFSVGVKHAF